MSKRGDNIHKRKDGRWEGRYKKGIKTDGTILYGSVYGKTHKEVKEKLLKVQQETTSIKVAKEKEKTFGEVLELWMENNRIRLKGGTINKYQRLIDAHIMKDLGKIKISDMTSLKVNSYLADKLQNGRINGNGGLSASYVRSIMLIVNATLKYAVQESMCQPLKTPILKPILEKKELSILSSDEQKKLENYLIKDPSPSKIGVLLSLYTGLRIGEICALTWDDIDFCKQIIRVRHTVARVGKTNGQSKNNSCFVIDSPKTQSSKRDIPISSVLQSILKESYANSSSKYVISETKNFVSPRTYEYRYHRLLDESGISSVNYHTLRHTFASRCVEAGVDVKSLSEILGHSNVSITLNTYVHSSMEQKRNQLEKI